MKIQFTVSYTLQEYLSIVGEYVVALSREKELEKHPERTPSEKFPFTLVMFRFFASIAFYFKKRRMPVCEFVIDEDRIKRTTQHGTLSIEWNEIVNLHESKEGFILFKEKGGLPIPFRCITETERNWIKARCALS